MTASQDKLLFVDDEPNVLNAIRRQLGRKFDVSTATSGSEGLNLMSNGSSFAVVVSDMRMPEMNGVEFLGKVKQNAPETVRVMLTGYADMDSAIAAVNEGNIFRFITKPCPSDLLEKVLLSAVDQYHLVKARRELLENTLNGAIKVLVDILSLTNPVAFSRASRIKHFVEQIAAQLNVKHQWMYTVAAMLSQIGCVTIPTDTLEKVYYNRSISEEEKSILKGHPQISHDLISNIPHLELASKMILNQNNPFTKDRLGNPFSSDPVTLGADMLHVATDLDILLTHGYSFEGAINVLYHKGTNEYNPEILKCLKHIEPPKIDRALKSVQISSLTRDMVIEEEVRTRTGLLLVTKGQQITPTVKQLLENHLTQKNIKDAIMVSLIAKPKL
ncbi:MAG: HD domain-containing phosphohydrolase [Candidatus Auribacterota bacterium]